jgi:hypothetical protein
MFEQSEISRQLTGQTIQTQAQINTGGDGLWSRSQAEVKIERLVLGYVNDKAEFGELRVYFNTRTWDVSEQGLIYSDMQFVRELREHLVSLGFTNLAVNLVYYSEQGMQGEDYVSLDCGGQFLREFSDKAHNRVDAA